MTRWWLIPAILVGALIWAALFAAAHASDTFRWSPECHVTIAPSHREGVEAEVTFLNDGVHKQRFQTVTIGIEGLSVDVTVETNTHGADDTMTVTPPAGYIAYPPEVTVPEGGVGVILILEEVVS